MKKEPGQAGRRVTIRDVALTAGVAVGTASKALNGQGHLALETRHRVQEVAERLGFHPNDLAKSLVRGRSFTVGVITSDGFGRFTTPMVSGIEESLGTEQISVFLCNGQGDPERERQYVRSLLEKHVDGIIVAGRRTDPRPRLEIGNNRIPVLYAYAQADPGMLCLLPDDEQGGYVATRHLLDHDRRQLAHITGPERFEAARLRLAGLRRAMAESDLSISPANLLHGPWEESWGRDAVEKLLDGKRLIDGIFCGSDQIARGVCDELRERGVRVPDDIAVVGFDNWEIIAAATRPPLTTVDMNLKELGELAGKRLLEMIGGAQQHGVERLPCTLVIRESSGVQAVSTEPRRDGIG
jgi:LacI family transcriptional regulator